MHAHRLTAVVLCWLGKQSTNGTRRKSVMHRGSMQMMPWRYSTSITLVGALRHLAREGCTIARQPFRALHSHTSPCATLRAPERAPSLYATQKTSQTQYQMQTSAPTLYVTVPASTTRCRPATARYLSDIPFTTVIMPRSALQSTSSVYRPGPGSLLLCSVLAAPPLHPCHMRQRRPLPPGPHQGLTCHTLPTLHAYVQYSVRMHDVAATVMHVFCSCAPCTPTSTLCLTYLLTRIPTSRPHHVPLPASLPAG